MQFRSQRHRTQRYDEKPFNARRDGTSREVTARDSNGSAPTQPALPHGHRTVANCHARLQDGKRANNSAERSVASPLAGGEPVLVAVQRRRMQELFQDGCLSSGMVSVRLMAWAIWWLSQRCQPLRVIFSIIATQTTMTLLLVTPLSE
jgi:hypothetical protein